MSTIETIHGRQVLDSRGNPTVAVEVGLASGARGAAIVPSGASTGEFEAVELRDGGDAWGGKGVTKAVANVNDEIAAALAGARAADQGAVDAAMKKLDGTPNKGRLGANAILGVSLAVARAAAADAELPLYRYLAELYAAPEGAGGGEPDLLPVPMMNVLNGGAHADNSVDFQEFMIVPAGAPTFSECIRLGAEVFHALKRTLHDRGLSTAVGDEGGFAPDLPSNEAALEMLVAGVEAAGHTARQGRPDRARSRGQRVLPGRHLRAQARGPQPVGGGDGRLLGGNARPLPDRLARGRHGRGGLGRLEGADRAARRALPVGRRRQLRHQPRSPAAWDRVGVANSILVKLNQIGTVSETLETIRMAREAGYTAVISHRSGETEDTTIADLAVGTGAGQIKTGAPSRTDRVAKYNRLLAIEEELGDSARFLGRSTFDR